MDKIIGVSELRKSIAAKIKEVHEKRSRYIVMQHSKAKAVLLSPEEIETLEIMADKDILQDIRRAKEDIVRGEYSTYEDFFKKKLPEKPDK
ncbi:MAG: type II toxin-antitoxin system Phd/YefM family antitoxin [Acidobacteria bacterium]|nr:type II toxin-antitoxin system Phd/YefM family antitoxin [Acidobacteriota bacterium]MBU4203234.1 type II toxin-antitoxin system Phd/YefM family antitoxin [Acidobacteriota bacterium]MBU4254241.1 type II toxin-antitoxin system Phd/YefM family antitoxin [Acidobacteriota bacterium]